MKTIISFSLLYILQTMRFNYAILNANNKYFIDPII